MIIFFDKVTGEIKGTIEGRIHPEEHDAMHIGTPDAHGKITVNWIPIKFYDKEGNALPDELDEEKRKQLAFSADFTPDHPQKDLFMLFDQRPTLVYNYYVDPETLEIKEKPKA